MASCTTASPGRRPAPTRPTLLCLHQTPKSGWDYEPLMPVMAADRVIVAPDTPGYGGSDAPPAPVAIEDYAEVMAALMQDLQAKGAAPPGPFDVMGYHTGSLTATQLGLARPERVRRLVLLGLAAFDAEERRKRKATLDRFPTPKADGSNLMALWTLVETLNDPRIDTEWRHLSFAENLRSGSRLPWGFGAVYDYDFLGALAALVQPTLVLCPEDDLYDNTLKVADVIPHGRLVELRAAHGLLKLDTAKVAAILRGFLDSDDAPHLAKEPTP